MVQQRLAWGTPATDVHIRNYTLGWNGSEYKTQIDEPYTIRVLILAIQSSEAVTIGKRGSHLRKLVGWREGGRRTAQVDSIACHVNATRNSVGLAGNCSHSWTCRSMYEVEDEDGEESNDLRRLVERLKSKSRDYPPCPALTTLPPSCVAFHPSLPPRSAAVGSKEENISVNDGVAAHRLHHYGEQRRPEEEEEAEDDHRGTTHTRQWSLLHFVFINRIIKKSAFDCQQRTVNSRVISSNLL